MLPPPETLLSQFAHRPVFTVCDPEDDRLSQSYWLCVPAADELDQDTEQVCNKFFWKCTCIFLSSFVFPAHINHLILSFIGFL